MLKISDLRFDDALRAQLPPPTDKERQELEQSVRDDGFREPLVAWRREDGSLLLVDGHTRYEIYQKLIAEGVEIAPPRIVERSFSSMDLVLEWMLKNQLGRRNLTREAMSVVRGQLYNLEKRRVGERGPKKLDQSEPTSTAERLAADLHVSPATLRREGGYVENLNSIEANVGPQARREILLMASGLTRRDVATIARKPAGEQAAAFAAMKERAAERRKGAKARSVGPRVGGVRIGGGKGIMPDDIRDWLKKFAKKLDNFPVADLEKVSELIERVRDSLQAELRRRRPIDAEPAERGI